MSDPSYAVKVLDSIPITAAAPSDAFSTTEFGTPATSPSGCTFTSTVLSRDLSNATYADPPNDCAITSGTLHDPYGGETIKYSTSAVRLNRIVSLEWAWANGAATLTPAARERFAADINNIVTTSTTNARTKDAHGPAAWLPSNQQYRCTYIEGFIGTVKSFGLTVDARDMFAMRRDLAAC